MDEIEQIENVGYVLIDNLDEHDKINEINSYYFYGVIIKTFYPQVFNKIIKSISLLNISTTRDEDTRSFLFENPVVHPVRQSFDDDGNEDKHIFVKNGN